MENNYVAVAHAKIVELQPDDIEMMQPSDEYSPTKTYGHLQIVGGQIAQTRQIVTRALSDDGRQLEYWKVIWQIRKGGARQIGTINQVVLAEKLDCDPKG